MDDSSNIVDDKPVTELYIFSVGRLLLSIDRYDNLNNDISKFKAKWSLGAFYYK